MIEFCQEDGAIVVEAGKLNGKFFVVVVGMCRRKRVDKTLTGTPEEILRKAEEIGCEVITQAVREELEKAGAGILE